jgi:2-amino-4-hydroxy-6-hydroxymethyldihydropteridine diphosphokinase
MAIHKIYLSLGSNLGDRALQIKKALKQLEEEGVRIAKRSSMYETEPVEYHKQGWFLNCAVEAETELTPKQLLRVVRNIEKELGRKRVIRSGPRTLDIDILIYDDVLMRGEELEIPHPRMGQRRFVLIPMAEIAPSLRHPELHLTMAQLLAATPDRSQVLPWPREVRT